MGTLLKTVGFTDTTTPKVKRATAVLSDTSVVLMVVDQNQSGLTGAGGDGTHIPKAYIYWTLDRITFTLKNTISLSTGAADCISASICTDSSDNLHIAWVSPDDGSIKYKLLTYSADGPIWSAGSTETPIAAPSVDYAIWTVDIDCIGTSLNPVVAAYRGGLFVGHGLDILASVRNASAAWIVQPNRSVSANLVNRMYADISISASTEAVVSNIGYFAVSFTRCNGVGNPDPGDIVVMYKTNVSTGVNVSITDAMGLSTGDGFNKGAGSIRSNWLFYDGAMGWVIASYYGTVNLGMFVAVFGWNGGSSTLLVKIPGQYFSFFAPGGGSGEMSTYGTVYYNSASRVLWMVSRNSSGSKVFPIQLSPGLGFAKSSNLILPAEDNYLYVNSVAPLNVFGGAQSRNTLPSTVDILAFYYSSGSTYRVEHFFKKKPLSPTGVLPAAGSTSQSNTPYLSLFNRMPSNSPPSRVNGAWIFATDSAFTTNVRFYLQEDSKFILAQNTAAPYNNLVSSFDTLPAVLQLFNGTWFVAGATQDEMYDLGPFSSPQSFTVGTLGSAESNTLNPTGGVSLNYGTGDVTFSWVFSDTTQSTDLQTAYRIIVEENNSGASVLDTGKITSTLHSVIKNISAGYKNEILRWKLILWNTADAAGPASDYQLFQLIDAASVTVITPANLSTVTTNTPVVTWSSTITSPNVQKSYLVSTAPAYSLLGLSNTSGWILSSATSFTIPSAWMNNNTDYAITVEVMDNLNVVSSDSNIISVAYTPAATPDPPSGGTGTYQTPVGDDGYVWVGIDPVGYDSDFVKFTLYRRKLSDTTYIKLTDWFDPNVIMTYKDYLVGSGDTYEYSVTQTTNPSGSDIESDHFVLRIVYPQSDKYWLLTILSDSSSGLPLYRVTDDTYTEEVETDEYTVLGRGRHIDYGTYKGSNGTLIVQLRDKAITGIAKVNYSVNSALLIRDSLTGIPINWTYTSSGSLGTFTQVSGSTVEPNPTGADSVYILRADALGSATTNYMQFIQSLSGQNLPALVPGDVLTLSVWVYTLAVSGLRLQLEAQDISNAIIGTPADVLNPSVIETQDFTGGDDSGNPTGSWKRVKCNIIWPAGSVDHVVLRIRQQGNGSVSDKSLVISGVQVEQGAISKYFDGNTAGASWITGQGLSGSFTSGYYTARQQRQDIEALKAQLIPVYMRTPFGDTVKVALGDIGVKRIAGVGNSEFVDLTIPYSQVSDDPVFNN